MEKYTLKNGINSIIKQNKNTPRCALVLYSKLNKDEKNAGETYLMTQLMFQGTKNRTSEQLANELDENAIDISVDKKSDYIRLKVLCLNEDIEQALEIFSDILHNSTFNDYKKEITKLKGEFEADLDSPKVQAQDEYYRTIFKNHPYGIGRKEILESIDNITKEDLIEAYNDMQYNAEKNISFVGDIETSKITELFEKYLGDLKIEKNQANRKEIEKQIDNRVSIIEKEDANQAQIFKGWLFPSIYSPDYPAIVLLNTILGSSGLSSRLFLELREKRGLAYTVRSVFEPFILGGNFYVYIATEPQNIKTCFAGFEEEITKIMTEIISDEELENAKNNAIGKRQFYKETNLLESILNGYYEFLGLGYKFEEELISKIKEVSKEQLLEVASKYFATPNSLCTLAPKKFLEEAGLL